MSEKQKTIRSEISLRGMGLHTGSAVNVSFKPAHAGSGIRFVRVDLPGSPVIKAEFDNVLIDGRLPRCTAVGTIDTAIHTVEHLMSVLCGLEIDNIIIEINGNELPGLDGSGIEYLRAVKKAGIVEQEAAREHFELKEPIWVERNGSSIYAVPASDYRVVYTLDYHNHPAVHPQFVSVAINPDTFEKEIVLCRTFCLEDEAKALRDSGLGKGANYNNTLVIGKTGVIGNTVRFDNEFARHKVMDFMGDLYLLGVPIRAHVVAVRSGHTLNFELLKKINQQRQRYKPHPPYTPSQDNGNGIIQFNIGQIRDILPHRFPFLLVDRVLALEPGKRIVAIKNVTINEPFFQGHFPTRPIMPGVLMVEAMAQAGGLLMLTNPKNKGKIALFMGAHNVKFRKVVNPGDQLLFEAEPIRDRTKTAHIRATTKVEGTVVAEAELLFSYAGAEYLNQ